MIVLAFWVLSFLLGSKPNSMATCFSFGFIEMGLESGLLRSSKLLISSFWGFQHHNISVGAIALDLEGNVPNVFLT